jgi:hypothetical protein
MDHTEGIASFGSSNVAGVFVVMGNVYCNVAYQWLSFLTPLIYLSGVMLQFFNTEVTVLL